MKTIAKHMAIIIYVPTETLLEYLQFSVKCSVYLEATVLLKLRETQSIQ